MATKREYLVTLGLAKEGRGKFSAAAHAALAEAEAQGVVFDEPVKPEPKPRKAAAPKPERPKVSLAKAVTPPKTEKPKTSQQTADAPTPLLMPKRKQKEGYVVERGTLIAYSTCAVKGGCGKPVQFCGCKSGPVAPHYLDKGVAGTPLLLDKPVV
jgi:hypothetical protein